MHKTAARMILKDAPIMWRRINSIGVILDCNSTYANRLHYSKSQILGKSIFEHVPKTSWCDMNDSLKTWFATGRVQNIQITFQRRDKTTFPGMLHATSLYNADNLLLGSNTAIFDMTLVNQTSIQQYSEFFKDANQKLDTIKEEQYDTLDGPSKSEYEGLRDMFEMLLNLNLNTLKSA